MNESTERTLHTNRMALHSGNGNGDGHDAKKGTKIEKYANNKLLSACKSTRNYEITELN